MQPYLFPYLGYFQLIHASDVFILGDDLQYIKQGWVNRNKILVNGKAQYIIFPLKKGNYSLNINERFLADDFEMYRHRMLRTIFNTYGRAPMFKKVAPLIERTMKYPETNLAKYVENSIREICNYMQISTPIFVSSTLNLSPSPTAQDLVIQTTKKFDGDTYINPIGGLSLYDFDYFQSHGIDLRFHKMKDVRYFQYGLDFEPCLSIIDVLMFNEIEELPRLLTRCTFEQIKDSGKGMSRPSDNFIAREKVA